MTSLSIVLILASLALQENPQERPRVPKDSIELVVVGCLTGRALKATEVREVDVQRGPDVRSRAFRLAGKGDVMKEVKREDGHLVEVTGLVKRSALDDHGIKVGKRIEIAGGNPAAGSGKVPSGTDTVAVMDVSSIRQRATSCR
jgi:hypothetical protein